MDNSGVRSKKSEVKSISACIVFLVFTVYCSLFTAAYADNIKSSAALVMEAATGRILYGKNPNLKRPPASTTKLMTAMVVLDKIDIDAVVTISEKAAGISPHKANLKQGERITVKTLLYTALMTSANDAAYALSEAVGGSEERFAGFMNQKALALGMTDSHFINSTGLPGRGQYTTAHDLARMLRQALQYPLVREIINTKSGDLTTEDGRSMFLKNINKLLWEDDAVIGGKTGYTREAKHCFVCARQEGNETIISAVLGAPSRGMLWKESGELLNRGFVVKNSHEEPVVHFTKADYRPSVRKAAYVSGKAEVKKVTVNKTNKKNKKYAKKKNKERKAKNFAKKYKVQREDGSS